MDEIFYKEVFSRNSIFNIQFEIVKNGAIDCKLAAIDSATSMLQRHAGLTNV